MCMHLDQLGLLERAYLPGYTVYACVGEDECRPLGMIMFFFRHRTLVIEWLYVEPRYRGAGYADLLLSTVFEMRESGQAERIAVYLPGVYGRSFICRDEDTFLSDNFGAAEVSLPGEWHAALMALAQHPKCLVPGQDDGIIYTPFAELSSEKTKETLGSFSAMKEDTMLYPVHELTRDYDGNTSFAAFENTENGSVTCGGLLVHCTGESLYIACFFGDSRKICIGLWTRFIKAALEHYPGRTRVTMILRSENADQKYAALMDDLFQINRKGFGRHIDAALLYAEENEDPADALLWDELHTDWEL